MFPEGGSAQCYIPCVLSTAGKDTYPIVWNSDKNDLVEAFPKVFSKP